MSLLSMTQTEARWILAGLVLLLFIFVMATVIALGFFVRTAGIMKNYMRGVAYVLGGRPRLIRPGIYWYPPFISTVTLVDTRAQPVPLTSVEATLSMNVRVTVLLRAEIEVHDPVAAVNRSVNYLQVVADCIIDTWQRELTNSTVDRIVSDQSDLVHTIRERITAQVVDWGTTLRIMVVERVMFPEVIEQALSREAAATFDLRGDQVRANGESVLAPQYLEAAKLWLPGGTPAEQQALAFRLRELATLEDMQGSGSVIVGDARPSTELP